MILEKKMVSEPSDAPPAGLGVNPLKLGEMSVEERRSLVREIHQQAAAAAPELLQSWSRRDLLELLCLEMGNQKKFTGLTKFNIIDSLLTAIAGVKKNKDKKKKKKKKKKKMEGKKSPMVMNSSVKSVEEEPTPSNRRRKNPNPGRLPLEKILAWELADKGKFCRNPGCRAAMRGEESFCRRCSCHLCGKFDENKDPSLWLASKFDHLRGETSYHLECVLNHPEFFHGRVNLLGSLREQLSVARSARRVGALCYRISLSRRIMAIENRLKDLWDAVEMAARELEAEVGNLESLPEALRASEVHGLSSAREVHSLCTAALAMVSSSSSSSPATQDEFWFKSRSGESWNSLPQIADMGDEDDDDDDDDDGDDDEEEGSVQGSHKKVKLDLNRTLEEEPGSSSKRKGMKRKKKKGERGLGLELEGDYEHCVKTIRRLEREGQVETSWRVKFLTWLSLKASTKERRVVSAFINAMADDPASLAGQLIDTFADGLCINPTPPLPSGFCTKLFH